MRQQLLSAGGRIVVAMSCSTPCWRALAGALGLVACSGGCVRAPAPGGLPGVPNETRPKDCFDRCMAAVAESDREDTSGDPDKADEERTRDAYATCAEMCRE